MSRADYNRATNSAYNVIYTFNINKIPVCLDSILHSLPRLKLMTYERYAELNRISIHEVINDYGEFGSLIFEPLLRRYLLLYNDSKSLDVIRFTIAHELGHYFLTHKEHNEENDKEANCFARNLLCPLPALDVLSQNDYFYISSIFGISTLAAITRISFIRQDRYHLDKELYTSVNSTLGSAFFMDHFLVI